VEAPVNQMRMMVGKDYFRDPDVNQGFYSRKRAGVADVDPKVMEPFEPIPGRPPRKVVVDRQRKLFASLEIEELLLELVSITNFMNSLNSYNNRALTTVIQASTLLIGCLLSRLMIRNMTAVCHMSGSPSERLRPASIPFAVKDSSARLTVVLTGDPCLSGVMMKNAMSIPATGTALASTSS
jgi:hypothetical protein